MALFIKLGLIVALRVTPRWTYTGHSLEEGCSHRSLSRLTEGASCVEFVVPDCSHDAVVLVRGCGTAEFQGHLLCILYLSYDVVCGVSDCVFVSESWTWGFENFKTKMSNLH